MVRRQYDHVTVPVIIQAIGGDLRLRGRPGRRLLVDGEGAEVTQLGEGQPYVVRSSGDARVTVPDDVTLSVQQVGGDAVITDIGGALDLHAIGGDLNIRGVRDVQVKTVGGDLRLKHSDGSVSVETIGSDATIRDIDGAVRVANIGSDLYLRSIEGHCVVENVGSDLVLNIDFLPDREYRFSAGSDILCRIREGTDATFILPPDTEIVLDVEAEIEEDEQGAQVIVLGDGTAQVVIDDAQTLRLVGEAEDYMVNFGVQIEEELETRLSELEEKLGQQLQGLDERIQAKATVWASQAEKMAERAQRQAERTMERVRRSMERSTKRKRGPGPRRIDLSFRGGALRDKDRDPITEEERLLILKMVRENTITIEEAERLLSALDS